MLGLYAVLNVSRAFICRFQCEQSRQKNHMPHNLRNVDSARAYPVSDALCHHLSRTRSGQGLLQKRRLRLKKLANLRFLTINVGTMTGKSREIADMMRRRNIGIACIQETRWKGSKAREIGDGYNMYYHGEGVTAGASTSRPWESDISDCKSCYHHPPRARTTNKDHTSAPQPLRCLRL